MSSSGARIALPLAITITITIAVGCSDPPRAVVSDAGPRDASRMDAAPIDSGEPPIDDAGTDAGDDADARVVVPDDGGQDAGETPLDGGPEPDASGCIADGGGFDFCLCGPPLGADCSSAPCGAGEACVVGSCGAHCEPAGAPCASATDCPAGSTCTAMAGASYCVATGSGCSDSRDCPRGFACESGACRERRIPCAPKIAECPFGYTCRALTAMPYCVRVPVRCTSDAACPPGGFCVDVDGDGATECIADGSCRTNSECGAGEGCRTEPAAAAASCGLYGVCRTAADCGVGQTCVDLWGDGILECIDGGGTCATTSACAGTSICATPAGGGAPRCIGGPL